MTVGVLHHPIQRALDEIWNAGHTPRIQVDATREDVEVPDFVRTKWGARLVLDLDASYPLNITFDQRSVELDLAFQGVVSRCSLPWESIYVVLDRTTGQGIVVEAHVPSHLDKETSSDSRKGSSKPGPTLVATSSKSEAPRNEEAPSGEADKAEEAKRRRARFKVIEGGG